MTACDHCYGRSANDRCLNCGAYLPARAALAAAPQPKVIGKLGWGSEMTPPQPALAWNGPGEKPHAYSPDYQAMGDCQICGHDHEAHKPAPQLTKKQTMCDRCDGSGYVWAVGNCPKCEGSGWVSSAPQPAPEREALAEVVQDVLRLWFLIPTDGIAEEVADALLARGLRLPGGDETMAWAVVDEDGRIDADSIAKDAMDVRISPKPCLRVVPVMIRLVEGGDDAAADNS